MNSACISAFSVLLGLLTCTHNDFTLWNAMNLCEANKTTSSVVKRETKTILMRLNVFRLVWCIAFIRRNVTSIQIKIAFNFCLYLSGFVHRSIKRHTIRVNAVVSVFFWGKRTENEQVNGLMIIFLFRELFARQTVNKSFNMKCLRIILLRSKEEPIQ